MLLKKDAERQIIEAWDNWPKKPDTRSERELGLAMQSFYYELERKNSPLLRFRDNRAQKWQTFKCWLMRHERPVPFT